MKTVKWMERSKVSFAVLLFFGLLSDAAFFLHSRTGNELFFDIGIFSLLGWMVNPCPVVFPAIGIWKYLSERRDAQMRNRIGKRWLLLPGLMVCAVVVYLFFGGLMVTLTGGV